VEWDGRRRALDTALQVLQSIGIVAGLYFSYHALRASAETQRMQQAQVSADTMLEFSKLIDSGSGHDGKMMIAIYHNLPLLKSHGGKFTTDDLDELLGDYQLLWEAYDAEVISFDMADDSFSDDVNKTIHNPEVEAYLSSVRREDNSFYSGLDDMEKDFTAGEEGDDDKNN
jgi:hypothetical protein